MRLRNASQDPTPSRATPSRPLARAVIALVLLLGSMVGFGSTTASAASAHCGSWCNSQSPYAGIPASLGIGTQPCANDAVKVSGEVHPKTSGLVSQRQGSHLCRRQHEPVPHVQRALPHLVGDGDQLEGGGPIVMWLERDQHLPALLPEPGLRDLPECGHCRGQQYA